MSPERLEETPPPSREAGPARTGWLVAFVVLVALLVLGWWFWPGGEESVLDDRVGRQAPAVVPFPVADRPALPVPGPAPLHGRTLSA